MRFCDGCGTPQPLHPIEIPLKAVNLARRHTDIAAMAVLFLATALTIFPLFTVDFTKNWGSIESAYISDSIFISNNFPNVGWFPFWYGGLPFHLSYPLLFIYSVAALHHDLRSYNRAFIPSPIGHSVFGHTRSPIPVSQVSYQEPTRKYLRCANLLACSNISSGPRAEPHWRLDSLRRRPAHRWMGSGNSDGSSVAAMHDKTHLAWVPVGISPDGVCGPNEPCCPVCTSLPRSRRSRH